MSIKDIDWNKDYYSILGLEKGADQKQIKNAFRQASVKWHPDKHQDEPEEQRKEAEDKFKEINEAYTVLSDEKLKNAYDNGQPLMDDDIFSGWSPFGDMNTEDVHVTGDDCYAYIDVSFEDLIHGIHNRKVEYTRKVRCKECQGTGYGSFDRCPDCNGTGYVMTERRVGNTYYRQTGPCRKCQGTGKINRKACRHCHGNGFDAEKNSYTLDIPGTNLLVNGSRLLISSNEGSESPDALGQNGRVIGIIRHVMDEKLELTRSGVNVVKDIELPWIDYLTGTDDCVILSGQGKKLKFKIGDIRTRQDKLRLKNAGLSIQGTTGDYIVNIRMKQPVEITDEQMEELKRIKENKSK